MTSATSVGPSLSVAGTDAADARGQFSWALFEWARNPYVVIITIYVFAPYFSNEVVGDPVRGQSILGYTNSVAGFFIAVLGPILGAIADQSGRRKMWIAFFVALIVPGTFGLWWALPAGSMVGLGVFTLAVFIFLNSVAFELSAVFHNSMLPHIAPHERIGGLSGLGLALGNLGSLIILVFMLYAFALPGVYDWPFLPDAPLFGLDQSSHQHARISGPIVAVWLILFSLPLFLFTPDIKRPTQKMNQVVRDGVHSLWMTVLKLRQYQNVATYLCARMLYNDGKTAVLIFGGVFAAGVFGWDTAHMLIYGIVLSIFAVAGGIVGGWLDDTLGSQRAILISIGMTCVGILVTVSMAPSYIFFFVPIDPNAPPLWAFPFFDSVPEALFVGLAIVNAIFITAAYANSRTMMARISPPSMVTEFFGLYALSGTATAFLGPAVVGFFTDMFNSQHAGFASVLILLVSGFLLMFLVKEEQAEALH